MLFVECPVIDIRYMSGVAFFCLNDVADSSSYLLKQNNQLFVISFPVESRSFLNFIID